MHVSAPRPLRLQRDKRSRLPGNDERSPNAENVHEYDDRHGHADHQRPRDDVCVDALHHVDGNDDHPFDDNHDTYIHVEYDHDFTLHPDGYDDYAHDFDSDDFDTNEYDRDDHAHNGYDADDHLDHLDNRATFDNLDDGDHCYCVAVVNDDYHSDDIFDNDCHYGYDADDHRATSDSLDDGDDYHYDNHNCRRGRRGRR